MMKSHKPGSSSLALFVTGRDTRGLLPSAPAETSGAPSLQATPSFLFCSFFPIHEKSPAAHAAGCISLPFGHGLLIFRQTP